jgi:regulator of sigma E protease
VNPATDAHQTIRVAPGSPAAAAGLATGDRLLAIDGALPGFPIEDQLYLAMRDGDPLRRPVRAPGREIRVELVPRTLDTVEERILGIAPLMYHLIDLKTTPLAAKTGLRKDDRILAVAGQPIRREFDFRESARGRTRRRPDPGARRARREPVELSLAPLTPDEIAALPATSRSVPTWPARWISVKPGTSADRAGMRDGDRILSIDGREMDSYKVIQETAKAARDGRTLVDRARATRRRSRILVPHRAGVGRRAPPDRLRLRALQPATYVYKTKGPLESVSAGTRGLVEVPRGVVADAEAHPPRPGLGEQHRRHHHDRRRVAQLGDGRALEALLLPLHAQH